MEIYITRFDSKTHKENKDWLKQYNMIGCIYGSPIKLSEKILPETDLLIIEMNNTKNIIEGIGIIKNKLEKEDKKKYKIYCDNNYNRFIYKSNKRIDKTSFNNYEKIIIKNLEQLLFKSYNHCKRGQGIQKILQLINDTQKQNFNYINFINNVYTSRFINIDKSKIKIL